MTLHDAITNALERAGVDDFTIEERANVVHLPRRYAAKLARKAERVAQYQKKMNKRDAKIYALREQGLTWPEVAKKMKTTVPTVRHAYAKYERLGQEAATC